MFRIMSLSSRACLSSVPSKMDLKSKSIKKLEISPIYSTIFTQVNNLGWSSPYSEQIINLEADYTEVYSKFINGRSGKTKEQKIQSNWCMALGQTINRSQKPTGGFVGQSGKRNCIKE